MGRIEQTFIYFAASQYKGRPAIKIGQSAAPWQRVKKIGDSIGHEVVLLASYEVSNRRIAKMAEKNWHEQFSKYALGHEWFEPASELLEEIDKLGPDDSQIITEKRLQLKNTRQRRQHGKTQYRGRIHDGSNGCRSHEGR